MRVPKTVTDAIDAAASKGADRLDRRRPNWFLDVDPKLLDMASGCMCVCGQLYGSYGRESVAKIVGGWVRSALGYDQVGERYGFMVPSVADEWTNEADSTYLLRQQVVWNRLERAWKNEIKARREAQQVAA